MIFDFGKFYKNLSRNPSFGYNGTKILGTLHGDLTTL